MLASSMSHRTGKSVKANNEISFTDFLPNSIVCSPQRRIVSHSATTQRMALGGVRTNVLAKPFIPGVTADESMPMQNSGFDPLLTGQAFNEVDRRPFKEGEMLSDGVINADLRSQMLKSQETQR
jgi:hypothetical protein